MIGITKDGVWDLKYEEITKTNYKNSKLVQAIKKHKFITGLLVSLFALVTVNTILIYNFFRILINL